MAAAGDLADALNSRVGGFFRNTVRNDSTCDICTGPSVTGRCHPCRTHAEHYPDQRADFVVTLSYAQGNHQDGLHQSAHTAQAYKAERPAPTARQNMHLMVRTASTLHGPCIAAVQGWWNLVTFVPSTKHTDLPAAHQAAAGLARQVVQHNGPHERICLTLGSGHAAPPREVDPERFRLPDEYRPVVTGKHVLVVDDTWTSGAKMQSAAAALKTAGAIRVTALVVLRWCRWDWHDHAQFLTRLTTPYDARICPAPRCLRSARSD